MCTRLDRKNYTVVLSEPQIYVDNESRKRSGHMTHAMAEFAPGCFIDFNSNCSAERHQGHFPYGWVEYRISKDNGKTYSDTKTLQYSFDSFLDGIYAISVEKAVACDDGTIVAFCLRNSALDPSFCTPWATPTVIRSTDGGETWSEPVEYSPFAGRTYDALYRNGVIYLIHFCNEQFLGSTEEHKYRIYTSSDNGLTFEELSVVPFDTLKRGYGSILFDDKGVLHAFAYNESAECEMDHAVSYDEGKTWEVVKTCYLDEGIRNPQTAFIDGIYVCHGRAKDIKGFVVYTSEDCENWTEAYYIDDKFACAYYSNNMNLRDENGNFLLIQYSSSYYGMKVNVSHIELRIEKK